MLRRGTRYLSILIVPDDGSKTLEFRISQRAIHAFKVISFVLLGLILLAGFCYWRTAERAAMAFRIKRENRRLVAENQKVKELSQTLKQVTDFRRRLIAMLGEGMPQEQETHSRSEGWSDPSTLAHSSSGRNGPEPLTPREWARWRPAIRPVDGWIVEASVEASSNENGSLPFGRQGVDMAAAPAALVQAVADGAVTFAGWNEERGDLVVLNHGGKYSTWYSGSIQFLVREGEWVQMGQPVAVLQPQASGVGALLHYEVWQGDTMRDPREFFVR